MDLAAALTSIILITLIWIAATVAGGTADQSALTEMGVLMLVIADWSSCNHQQ
jgi:hypothetical protein